MKLVTLLAALSATGVVHGGCGGGGQAGFLDVGTDDGGAGLVIPGRDASAAAPLDAHIEENHVAVKVVRVGCSGPCADVQAVASGGYPPYAYKWDDGTTGATRTVCPTADATYSVKVTDTGSTGEVSRAPETVTVPLTADVVACPDAGAGLDAAGDARTLGTLTVPGTADVWLAGQPDGAMLVDMGSGNVVDVAPANSPVEVPVVGGTTLTFSATGATSYTGGICFGPSPDGGCLIGINDGPANGISAMANVPADALVGVFLGPTAPASGATAPPAIDFSGNLGFASLAPRLDQVFFVGDGLTGTGTGAAQRFAVPSGATHLFLASSDALGGNQNNAGQFTVSVTSQ